MPNFPNFPFKAVVGGVETTVTGTYHGLYITRGCGLVTERSITPVRNSRNLFEMAQASRRQRRGPQGFFRTGKILSPRERYERASYARAWLRWLLSKQDPMPAREVLWRASREGISQRSLQRAKKRLGIRSRKVGGKLHGWGAVWLWSAIPG